MKFSVESHHLKWIFVGKHSDLRENLNWKLVIAKTSVFGISGIEDLLLEYSRLRETNNNSMSGQSVIAVGDSFELVFHYLSVEGIKENLLMLFAFKSNSDGLAGDVWWENLMK